MVWAISREGLVAPLHTSEGFRVVCAALVVARSTHFSRYCTQYKLPGVGFTHYNRKRAKELGLSIVQKQGLRELVVRDDTGSYLPLLLLLLLRLLLWSMPHLLCSPAAYLPTYLPI